MSSGAPGYSLLIATYNRPDVLRLCLSLASAQTVPPLQMVVVDASDGWEASRDACLETVRAAGYRGEFVYQKAVERSLTTQRNQALRVATSDILFLFDDDSLMYPECAERILEVYATFPGAAGVRASAARSPPIALDGAGATKLTGLQPGSKAERLLNLPGARWLFEKVAMQNVEQHFIPYEGWSEWAIPPSELERVGAAPERLFQGFLMTFRRSAIEGLVFEEAFTAYAAGEDLDFTYRAGKRGPLLAAKGALVYHHQAARGRLARDVVITLGLLNQAYCLRKHSGPNLAVNVRRFRVLMVRRFFAEAVKDLLSRRWTLPQVRGMLRAARGAPGVFAADPAEAESLHQARQRALIR